MTSVNSISSHVAEVTGNVTRPSNEARPNDPSLLTDKSVVTHFDNSPIDVSSVKDVLNELKEFLGAQESMSFSIAIDKDLGEPVISVVDEATGERVLQVPTEQALKISKAILEMRGLFVDESV